jgi:RNA polymerase sigma-70 factor (ECF subfamily)
LDVARSLDWNFPAAADNHPQMPTHAALAAAPDAELVRRARDGDGEAFAVIYARYHAVVYRFARLMSGASGMAEEVTQDVFVRLIDDLARYEPQRAALPTYLYGIARNVTRNRLRRERRFVALEACAPPDLVAPDDPCASLAHARELARLRRAIRALPSRYREVVILGHVHGLAYAQIAAIVGAPVGTIRSRLNRGREMIARRMDEEARAHDRGVRCAV